ncbi:winged helix-turn-helix domain-containing protein [Croceibacterium salegens]|nr:winged helix-turn-helix domain-containing protein [Croceibacterium salegens]
MSGVILRFGQVEFDRARERLSVAGKPVPLDRFSLAIFRVLLAHAGEEVSKDALLEAGWSGRVVQENSLAKAVGRLRSALGDDGIALETVHGRGYRLAAEVVETKAVVPPASRRRYLAVLAMLAAPVIAGATIMGLRGTERHVVSSESPGAVGRVLWVDDHPENNETEKRFLGERKIAVYQVGTTADAVTLLPMYEYGAVISDMGRGQQPLAGLQLLQAMRERGDERPFVLYTVHTSPELRRQIAEAGGQGVAENEDELYRTILPVFGLRPGKSAPRD